ncbi:MAG: alanine--tRNA ligase [Phycisphaerales bacterium]
MLLTSDQIRAAFIDFFKSKPHAASGHTFVPSSSVVPHEDPTLLFTNAGMNQFKPLFLGTADPKSPIGSLRRAVNSQKCIRAGGKHNDLDDVGKDTYHHTFFEMLGNWSFGDYFKKEAIDWAWELLTKVYGIPAHALYATYFGGHPASGLEPDIEARDLWLRYLPKERVLSGSMKDNFWEMGDTGPCGPCSEIHVDRMAGPVGGPNRDAAMLVNTGDPDVIEIWNLVFIQFNRETDRSLKVLPARHVDTGMGFERLTSILQHKRSNYDTDIFAPLFAAIETVTGARKPYTGKVGLADRDNTDTAYRVIADHIRTLTFAITDGAVPSNEGRGYVLRRILRRAVRYGRQTLGARTGFFSQLVPVVVDRFGEAFPELHADAQRVIDILKEEEESFGRTLERGCVLFDEACVRAYGRARLIPHLQVAGGTVAARKVEGGASVLDIHVPNQPAQSGSFRPAEMTPQWADQFFGPARGIPPEDAFKLYDTFGFPLDLTVLMAEERGLKVDQEGFNRLMEEARERARAGSKFSGEHVTLSLPADAIARLRHMGIEPTADIDKFHGRTIRARVQAIWNGNDFDGEVSASASMHRVGLILDKTNFYAEMGGQVGDAGRIHVSHSSGSGRDPDEASVGPGEFRVDDTQAFGGYVLHVGLCVRRDLRVGDEVLLEVDAHRRSAIASNHTATHLLNLALARALGPEVNQKGSLVAPEKLRFDFSHGRPVAPEELVRIEHNVRENIAADLTVFAEPAPLAEARAIKGLRAVFGEAYPDPVRVVSIGKPVRSALRGEVNTGGLDYSIEFCGGTHVMTTGAIADFAILAEEAIGKGTRRITAISGVPARAAIAAGQAIESRVAAAASLAGDTLAAEASALASDVDRFDIPLPIRQRLRGEIGVLLERVRAAQKQAGAARIDSIVATARSIADSPEFDSGSFIVTTIDGAADKDSLSAALNTIRQRRPRQAVMVVAPDAQAGKLAIIAGVPDLQIKRGLAAGEWVKIAAAACGGRGGGKPDLAQGGGTDLAKLRDVLDAATAFAFAKCPN